MSVFLLMLGLFMIALLIGCVFFLMKWVTGKQTVPLIGVLTCVSFAASFGVTQWMGNHGDYPQYRIVTDGKVFEIETKYYPLSDWERSIREYPTLMAVKADIGEDELRKMKREEHEARDWKEIK